MSTESENLGVIHRVIPLWITCGQSYPQVVHNPQGYTVYPQENSVSYPQALWISSYPQGSYPQAVDNLWMPVDNYVDMWTTLWITSELSTPPTLNCG